MHGRRDPARTPSTSACSTSRRAATLNLRSAEYHDIGPGGALPHPKHLDYGSLITVDFMLSDTDDFEGGTFSTLEADGTLQPRAFERGDMIIFLSHKYHCVAPVTAGRRNVLVCELWEGLPRICPQRCSDAFGPCYCRFVPPVLVVGIDADRERVPADREEGHRGLAPLCESVVRSHQYR